ncbi:hypothetical protein Bca101_070052 [Brassica carinata]
MRKTVVSDTPPFIATISFPAPLLDHPFFHCKVSPIESPMPIIHASQFNRKYSNKEASIHRN